MKVISMRIWKLMKVAKKLKHRYRVVVKNPPTQDAPSGVITQDTKAKV